MPAQLPGASTMQVYVYIHTICMCSNNIYTYILHQGELASRYELCGLLLGLALFHGAQLDLRLATHMRRGLLEGDRVDPPVYHMYVYYIHVI